MQRHPPGKLHRVVARGVVHEHDLVDPLSRDRLDGALEGPGSVHGRHHHDHLARRRSGTTSLHVDGAAASRGYLDRRGHGRHRKQRRGGRQRQRAGLCRHRCATGLRPADGVVQVGPPRSVPTRPCSHPNSACPPRQWLTRVTSRPCDSEPSREGRGREVNEMPRQVEVEPPVAEHPRLKAGRVRDGHQQDAAGSERRAASRIAGAGAGRCSSECQNTIADHSPSSSSVMSSSRTSPRRESRSSPSASRPRA